SSSGLASKGHGGNCQSLSQKNVARGSSGTGIAPQQRMYSSASSSSPTSQAAPLGKKGSLGPASTVGSAKQLNHVTDQ
ncbi:unnamed protein product, partial [Amoebophrya sp. A25]